MTKFLLKIASVNPLYCVLIATSFLLVADLKDCVSAETAGMPAIMDITFQDNLISAELVDAPLTDVLKQIQQEFGFKMHLHGDLSELITLSFNDIPLDKCLRLLTAKYSLSVASQPIMTQPEQNGAKQIAEIWVLSRSNTSQNSNITPVAPVVPVPASSDEMVSADENSPEDGVQEDVAADQVAADTNSESASKRQTIKTLAANGDSASVMALADFLRDVDKEIRQLTVNEISSVQSEEATQLLGQVLQDESDPGIRMIALRALSQRQSDATAQSLLEGALNDPDEDVKTLAGQLLNR